MRRGNVRRGEGVGLADGVGVEEGVSGLPLLLAGRNVARGGLACRRPRRPLRPNEVLIKGIIFMSSGAVAADDTGAVVRACAEVTGSRLAA